MDYRIDPARVEGRTSRSVVAIAAVVSVALVAGIVALTISGRPDPQVSNATASVPTRAAVAPRVQCHEVAADLCGRIATAALGVVADPTLGPPASVDVWGSLLCNDTFDCPPARSEGRRPAGSAVVALATSMVLWVNVVQRDADYDRGSTDAELDAWIIPSRPRS